MKPERAEWLAKLARDTVFLHEDGNVAERQRIAVNITRCHLRQIPYWATVKAPIIFGAIDDDWLLFALRHLGRMRVRSVIASFLVFAMLVVSGGANADTIYDIVLPPGIGGHDVSVSGTLTMDDNNTIVGSGDISAFSVTVSGICGTAGAYSSCSQTMSASNSIFSCNDCLVRSGSDLSISPNYTIGLGITPDADNCGSSGNQACAEVSVYTNHNDSEYVYSVCSSGSTSTCTVAANGITTFGNVLVAQAVTAPEIDPASAVSGLTLLLGGLVVLRGRRAVETPVI
jgi:hypothetical protein